MLTRNKKLLILFAIILSFFIFRKELFQDKQNAVPLEDELHHESPKIRKVSTHLKRVRFMMVTYWHMPCPFTGCKMFRAGPNFIEPAQKYDCI